jgi:hypothetical protein
LTALRNVIDKKVNEKRKIIGKFNEQVKKDITALLTEVADIEEEANVSYV